MKEKILLLNYLQDFLVSNTQLPANAQLPSTESIIGSSGVLTPQLPDTSKTTKKRTKKHSNHKHGQGFYLELKEQIVSIKTNKQYHLYHHPNFA